MDGLTETWQHLLFQVETANQHLIKAYRKDEVGSVMKFIEAVKATSSMQDALWLYEQFIHPYRRAATVVNEIPETLEQLEEILGIIPESD